MKNVVGFVLVVFLALFANASRGGDRTYIHEPYWEADVDGVTRYAKRIIKTISPYFVASGQVDKEAMRITTSGQSFKVRQIQEFGRVLPNIFLRNVLARVGEHDRAVPRIFLLPKKNTDVVLEFFLPHRGMRCNSGHNCIQVLSDSFEIFQEFVEGEGKVGDHAFFPFGHTDFNATQVITSKHDGKKYLIDTKESKNFFIPELANSHDAFFSYWLFKIGRLLPQKSVAFGRWLNTTRDQLIANTEEHFEPGQESVVINLGALRDMDLLHVAPINYGDAVFDDDTETERYFANPKDNIARYMYLGRVDLIRSLLKEEHKALSLSDISVPNLVNHNLRLLNPIQFALGSDKISLEDKRFLVDMFSKEEHYFLNENAKGNLRYWPLYLALKTKDFDIVSRVVASGADVNGQIRGKTILYHGLMELVASLNGEEAGDLLAIRRLLLEKSDDASISEVIREVLDTGETASIKWMSRETRTQLASVLIGYLRFVNKGVIERLVTFGAHSLLSDVTERDFDYGSLLITVMREIKDPRHDYIRRLSGDLKPVDYSWYELVEKLLQVKSRFPLANTAIDEAIAHALINNKAQILCTLLQHLPKPAPKTNMVVAELAESQYEKILAVDAAIEPKCSLFLEFLMVHDFPVNRPQIEAVLLQRPNDDKIDALTKNAVLNFHLALSMALDHRDESAATKILQAMVKRSLAPTSENYREIFQSPFENLKTFARSLGGKDLVEPVVLMKKWEVDAIAKKGDFNTLNNLVDSNINLGEVLLAVVHRMIFGKQEGFSVDSRWLDLLEKLSTKDLPAEAVDQALASALINSRVDIVNHLIGQVAKLNEIALENQRVWKVIKLNVSTRYSKDRYFQEALSTGNVALVKMYLRAGMAVTKEIVDSIPSFEKKYEELLRFLESKLQ